MSFASALASRHASTTMSRPSSAPGQKPIISKTRSGVSLVRNAGPSKSKAKPRDLSSSVTPHDMSSAFGDGGGRVYIKGQTQDEDDLLWGGGGSKKGKGGPGTTNSGRQSPAGSGSTTPVIGSETDRAKSQPNRSGNQTYRISNTLRSDLARLAEQQQSVGTSSGQDQEVPKPKGPELLRSREVRRLDRMIEELAGTSNERSDEVDEPCFCQARFHPLSEYTPSCSHCGLIICSLQLPHVPCPSCSHLLLTPLGRTRVIGRLRKQIDEVLAREEQERIRQQEEERRRQIEARGGGMFPTLGGGFPTAVEEKRKNPLERQRKVITIGGAQTTTTMAGKLGAKPKGATIKTYTSANPKLIAHENTPTFAPSQTRAERKAKPTRIPRPLELSSASADTSVHTLLETRRANESWQKENGRPWGDMDFASEGLEVLYMDPSESESEQEGEREDTRRRRTVPGAEIKENNGKEGKKKKNKSKGKGKKPAEGVVEG